MPQTRSQQKNLIALTFASVLATTVVAWGLGGNKDTARTGRDARSTSGGHSLQLEGKTREPR